MRPRAFTLLELMVVVVLIGLTATMVGVQLRGTTEAMRLRAATLEIEQTLRLARHRAMTSRQPTWLVFDLGAGRFRMVFATDQAPTAGSWRALDGVTIAGGLIRGSKRVGDSAFSVRLMPSGGSLPWALELHAGQLKRVVWSDGISGLLRFVDDIDLAAFKWDPPAKEDIK